jgi:hypothetical protein
MRVLAALALVAALGASGASATVTVSGSSMTFKDAMKACGPGPLAAITFASSHLRVAEQPGVTVDLDAGSPTAQVVTLSSLTGASAVATIDAVAHTVTAKHVTLAAGKQVACVSQE